MMIDMSKLCQIDDCEQEAEWTVFCPECDKTYYACNDHCNIEETARHYKIHDYAEKEKYV
jgi:hypothetical protein